ncbi:hypothetical protein [Gordonia sp. C13]|uniref:hypothetical protein n=1 Tax=Gordonia sp. C13 TaxID=2935078 RepID=UPI002009F891|nr:hypothetical protein [Gordonia sp. C13]MCK8613853.1 hypothetical protein [Gordonia sp. C13]
MRTSARDVRMFCALATGVLMAIGGTALAPRASSTPADPVPRIVSSAVVHNTPVALDTASSTTRVRYSSTSVRGRPTEMTGTVLLPRSAPPRGGWPLAVWNHMTVGAADSCTVHRSCDSPGASADDVR